MYTTPRTAIVAITAALLLATSTPTASASPSPSPSPSLKEVCTGKTWPPAEGLIAEVCQVINTHPEGPRGSQRWDCRTLGNRQCGGAMGGRGVLR